MRLQRLDHLQRLRPVFFLALAVACTDSGPSTGSESKIRAITIGNVRVAPVPNDANFDETSTKAGLCSHLLTYVTDNTLVIGA